MSEYNLKQATDFDIRELTIVTNRGPFDLRGMFQELNIFDSVLSPCMTGNLLIVDSLGLSESLLLDGTEILLIDIEKGDGLEPLKKRFRVFSQKNRNQYNQTSEAYVLMFASEEFILSEQQRVSQHYEDTYSEIMYSILQDYLKPANGKLGGNFDDSLGLTSVVIPFLKPFDAINWCAKRAIGTNDKPNFVFFENLDGFNICSLDTIIESDSIMELVFSPKNLNYLSNTSFDEEFFGVRAMQVITQNDFVKKTRAGVFAGSVVGFDPITRTVKKTVYNFNDVYNDTSHSNPNPIISQDKNKTGKTNYEMQNARQLVYLDTSSRDTSAYLNEKDAESLQVKDVPQKYIFQRQAIFQNLFTQRVKLVLPGNFLVTSGKMIDLNVPRYGVHAADDDNFDMTLKGTYMIAATRHIIRYTGCETIIEVVTDSTERVNVQPNTAEKEETMTWYDN